MQPPIRRYKKDALIIVVILMIWTSVWRVQDIYPILGSVKLPLMVEGLVILLFATASSPQRGLKWVKSPMLTIVLAMLGIMVVGLPTSLWPGKGVTFITTDFFPTIVLFIAVAGSLREESDIETLALGLLTGGVIYAGYVYKSHAVLVNGRLGSLEFYDANDFALLLVCTMPFAIYFMRPGVKLWKRLYGLLAMALFLIMLIRSGSRGGFLAFIAVMLYTLFRYNAIPTRARLFAVVGGATFLVVMGGSTYWDMMGTLLHPKNDYNMTEEGGRKQVWQRGIGYMITHPVVGVGVRAFPQAEGMLSEISKKYAAMGRGLKWSVAHNSFVEIGAELGLPALILFVTMFFIGIRDMMLVRVNPRRRPYTTQDDQAFAQTLIASLVGFLVAGFFVSAEYFPLLYVFFGLTVAVTAVQRRRMRAMKRAMAQAQAQAQALGTHPGTHHVPVPQRPPVQWLPAGS